MLRKFQHAYHVPGTLSADLAIYFKAPSPCTLLHVSAVGSNSNNGLIKIGTSSNDDAYLEEASIGDSGTPVEFDQDDFVDDQFPRISDGDVVKITLDHDGDSGTAAHDFTLVLTFAEG
jgi:hypothetical protein